MPEMQIAEGHRWPLICEWTQHAARYGLRSGDTKVVQVQFGRRGGTQGRSFCLPGLWHGLDNRRISRKSTRSYWPSRKGPVRKRMFIRSNKAHSGGNGMSC